MVSAHMLLNCVVINKDEHLHKSATTNELNTEINVALSHKSVPSY